jgi:hypothetical protein
MKNVELYKEVHESNEFYGNGGALKFHLKFIQDLIEDTKPRTLLDYGCGKGSQYLEQNIHNLWGGLMPSLYDPAIPMFSELPDEQFDGVICVDVMEHIPEDEINMALLDIFERATRFVFLGISTEPAKTILPDGTNAHCTIKDTDWWQRKIFDINRGKLYTHLHTYGNYNDYRIYYEDHYLEHLWLYNE